MPYDLGNPELDAKLAELVSAATTTPHTDLITELIVTAIKLGRDGASRADLKLINTALKEMRYSNLVFARHKEPKVTIYGSARIKEGDPNYALTEEFASIMAKSGWGIITGAGPGIMEAGSRGAGIDHSLRGEHPPALRGRDPQAHCPRAHGQLQVFLHEKARVREGGSRLRPPAGWLGHPRRDL